MAGYFEERGIAYFGSAKEGDTIAYQNRYSNEYKFLKIVKAVHRNGRLYSVTCDDKSRWTGNGKKWGTGSFLSSNVYASLIRDLDTFKREVIEKENKRLEEMKRREEFRSLLSVWVPSNLDCFTDEEKNTLLETIRSARYRKAGADIANSLARMAR